MSRPSLTPHQREVYDRCKTSRDRRVAHRDDLGPRLAAFVAHTMPKRIVHQVLRYRRNDGPMVVVSRVGSAGALAHLADKGYLAVLIEDLTTPVYVLVEDLPL